jgi:hypothetical protein
MKIIKIDFIHQDICIGEINNCLIKIMIKKNKKYCGHYLNLKNKIVLLLQITLGKSLDLIKNYLKI